MWLIKVVNVIAIILDKKNVSNFDRKFAQIIEVT